MMRTHIVPAAICILCRWRFRSSALLNLGNNTALLTTSITRDSNGLVIITVGPQRGSGFCDAKKGVFNGQLLWTVRRIQTGL
jgi:hypothetical protein